MTGIFPIHVLGGNCQRRDWDALIFIVARFVIVGFSQIDQYFDFAFGCSLWKIGTSTFWIGKVVMIPFLKEKILFKNLLEGATEPAHFDCRLFIQQWGYFHVQVNIDANFDSSFGKKHFIWRKKIFF